MPSRQLPQSPRLVIFDCDGVAADGEVIAFGELAAEMTARMP